MYFFSPPRWLKDGKAQLAGKERTYFIPKMYFSKRFFSVSSSRSRLFRAGGSLRDVIMELSDVIMELSDVIMESPEAGPAGARNVWTPKNALTF